MHPPQWVLDALYRIHPQVRLGWEGFERVGEELNAGRFGLIQLYHQSDAAQTYLEPWGDRGPLFGKRFDPLIWVPIYVIDLPAEDIFGGKVISLLKRWITPIRQRYEESAREKGAAYKSAKDNLAGEMAGKLMYDAKTATNALGTAPKKFLTTAEKSLLTGDTDTDVSKTWMPENQIPEHAAPMR